MYTDNDQVTMLRARVGVAWAVATVRERRAVLVLAGEPDRFALIEWDDLYAYLQASIIAALGASSMVRCIVRSDLVVA